MKQVKVSVPLDPPKDGYPPAKEELLWCTPSDKNLWVVDNIPFYARDISLGDVISTRRVRGRLKIKKVEKPSDNTTLHVFVNDLSDLPSLIESVVSFGGDVEQSDIPTLISVSIPRGAKVAELLSYLDQAAAEEKIGFEESAVRYK